jgi:MFS family permease
MSNETKRPGIARALRHRNYRLFFSGQSISLMGTWITRIATSWLVYRLTDSALLLGLVGFCGQIPTLLLAPFAGVIVDRWDRHKLLVWTQAISMVQSFVLAGLTLTGHITVNAIIMLNAVQGVVNAFDMPARQAFLVNMITDKEDLANAIALNSSMFNAARLIGPSIAGIIIAASSEGACFLIDGISYFAVLIALLMMRDISRPAKTPTVSVLTQFRDGVRYVYGFRPIRSLMTLVAIVSLLGVPYSVLMPVFANDILGGGPHTLGFLMTATGFGALMAALWLAARKSVVGLGRAILLATGLFGAGLVAFSFSRVLWLSVPCLIVAGFGMMVQFASSNTVIQTIVDDEKRGRVMSFYTMCFLGTAPFGSLLAGSLSARIGAPHTVLASGLCCAVAAMWFSRELPSIRAVVRPIYVRMGILPEMASGLQSAAQLMTPPED